MGFDTGHIAGISNDRPDFISHPDRVPELALTHIHCSQQIITKDRRLKSWALFRQSYKFTSLLASMLFSGHWMPPKSTKELGTFRTHCIHWFAFCLDMKLEGDMALKHVPI
jgi:hypothetical protein